jgi:hypothetical protein
MILNSHIAEQLAAAHRRDLLEAAQRERLVGQARAYDRRRFPSHAIRREARRPRPVESSLRASTPCTGTP